ncbi:MAG: GTPase HflX [Planctomycetia bacterium]|nr:GTPase HflX [Planctomycetia bacterium]
MRNNQNSPKNPGERNRDSEGAYNNHKAVKNLKDKTSLKSQKQDDPAEDPMQNAGPGEGSGFGDDTWSTERFDASTHTDKLSREETLESEKAVLVGAYLQGEGTGSNPLDELAGLAEAAGVQVVGSLIQRRTFPDPACYLGKGKVDELKEIVDSTDANVVLFDNDLAPGQTRNLEQKLKVKVLDRTELILDIFASRAQTYEACLAVELAQLEYSMPRLRRMWTHLERQAGGGVGLRGPGEKQLEVDRRIAQKKIAALKKELDQIQERKNREVAGRRWSKTVCLVGYTNAGKSTLLNRLTDSSVFVKDLLFATLDTRTRRWMLPGWGPVLLSDTVGFIRDLPHHLVASFRATLAEATGADLLIHVADASNPDVLAQILSAYKVLEDIGIREKDTVLALNKIDQAESQSVIDHLLEHYPHAIPISAAEGKGIEHLTSAVSDALSREFKDVRVSASVGDGRIAALLAREGEILSREYTDETVVFHCKLPNHVVGRLRNEENITLSETE